MAIVRLHSGKSNWDLGEVSRLLSALGHSVVMDSWPLNSERATFYQIEQAQQKEAPPAREPEGEESEGKEPEGKEVQA